MQQNQCEKGRGPAEPLVTFNAQLENVQKTSGVSVLALEVPNADVDTLRTLADRFREKYPTESIAVLASGVMVISAVTNDIVERGVKAGDLITIIGGRGGGRPNLAQGSLPENTDIDQAARKIVQALEEKLD